MKDLRRGIEPVLLLRDLTKIYTSSDDKLPLLLYVFFPKIFNKKFFFKDFLDFLIFYFILRLSPHIRRFFSSQAALAGPQSGIFEFFKKPLFCLFWTSPL
jgi:hypothetical protein